jgi:superfamily II DNA helicase RecQ
MGTFNRPNLTYEVRFKESLNAVTQGAILDLVTFVKKQHDAASSNGEPCSGIIYVHKREDCQGVASHIAKATGLSCLAYHAGLKDSEREETQRKWTDGICSIAVATVAFGMGYVIYLDFSAL